MGFWDMGYGTWDRDVENSHPSTSSFGITYYVITYVVK